MKNGVARSPDMEVNDCRASLHELRERFTEYRIDFFIFPKSIDRNCAVAANYSYSSIGFLLFSVLSNYQICHKMVLQIEGSNNLMRAWLQRE